MNMLEVRSFGQLPQVFSPRVSSKGVSQETKHHHEHTHSHTAWRIHGTLLSTAFMLLFPVGTVAIRAGVSKSFTYHWIVQATAASMVLAGVGIGVWKVVSGHGVRTSVFLAMGVLKKVDFSFSSLPCYELTNLLGSWYCFRCQCKWSLDISTTSSS
jgi:hypothetical protein